MRHWMGKRPSPAMVVALISLFVALGGSAVALNGKNTVQSEDLGPGAQVKAPDIAKNAVNGSDIKDISVTGDDIAEYSLDRVPYAVVANLGGTGRTSEGGDACYPDSTTYVECAVVRINLAASSMVLLSGQARAWPGFNSAAGNCRIYADGDNDAPGSRVPVFFGETPQEVTTTTPGQVTTTTVWGPFEPGIYSFRLKCNVEAGSIDFDAARITAVALSDS